jgi:ATP-dependent exoDNAse (exonuclease V) beta subunit
MSSSNLFASRATLLVKQATQGARLKTDNISSLRQHLKIKQIQSRNCLPFPSSPARLSEVYDTERHLLYVACTRARDHLLVTGVDPVSEFLDDFAQNR